MKQLRFISRLLVGFVFIFSGFVKAIDPMGSTYKFTDYFLAFGMDSFQAIAFPLAILLSTIEFIVGIALFFNARKEQASWMALLFMTFFTPLTLVLAISNPVTDCGCFGDALVLSNWETFSKNIIILALTLFVFVGRKEKDTYPRWQQNLLLISTTVFCLYLSVYSYKHLPIIDFRPYHIGANISDGMKIPEGAPLDEYRSILIYEKDGVKKEFDESNYPWQDSTWKFVDSKQIQTKKGYTPPIHDFSISNEMEGDITNMVLNDKNYTFLLVSKNLKEIDKDAQDKIKELSTFALENGISFIGLTASPLENIQEFKAEHQLPFEFYNTDEIQLKTIIRANPGLVLLRKGTILDKWHHNDFPKIKELQGDLEAYAITKHQKLNIKLIFISITSTLLLIISLFAFLVCRRSRVNNRL
jgi:uncharacterized membrane protein YphA (DoxX/SURF4 family)